MRVLFTTTAGAGHLQPLVPLARAAQGAGHEVAFACPASFRPTVEALGFPAFVAGREGEHDPELRLLWAQLPRYLERGNLAATAHVMAHIYGRVDTRMMVPDLLPLCTDWRPDAIVRDEGEFGGAVVADYLDLPHTAVQLASWPTPPPTVARPLALQLDAVRAAYDLAPDPTLAWLNRYLYLSFDPASYADPALPVPPTIQRLCLPRGTVAADGAAPAWLASIERPLIYVTLGTTFNNTPGILETILAGVRDGPYEVVVTVGRDRDPAELGPQPPHVHIERYIPQAHVLPHCALVVAHGGHSTLLATLREGIPQVLVPMGADQPDNAERAAAVGVARVLATDGLTSQIVREAVSVTLREPSYRENARRLRAEMEALPGVEHGIYRLEQLARDKQSPVQPTAS
jgi:UDP:flavonoid glycosyltransferase YjiC (YdhE family)